MDACLPQWVKDEEQKLFGDCLKDGKGYELYEYAKKYGSDRLKKFYKKKEKEDAENEKKGVIVN